MKNKVAVKALERLMNPVIEASMQAEHADAGFDGGEFSGPAHSRMLEQELRALCERVAQRFGITADELCASSYSCSMFMSCDDEEELYDMLPRYSK